MTGVAHDPWRLGVRHGSAAELHGDPHRPDRRSATWLEVERTAVVLGSAQRDDVVDGRACEAAAVEVVRRRSGGGVVLLVPGESLWLDVVVPTGDSRWRDLRWGDDVATSMWWLGDLWREALAACGVTGAAVHRGAIVHSAWSRLVCFDGIGAGEVLVDGRKAVGISQRRTRDWLRLQSSIHLAWRPELLVSLLAGSTPTAADLRPPYVYDGPDVALRAAVERALASR